MKNKLIVILGPTASGKSHWAIELAKKFNGEVVSADSRQIYRGMDIGTGKITKKEMKGIPHYLLDVAYPKKRFTVVQYQKLAQSAIKKILKKRKNPFLVGGAGFYIQAIVDQISIPRVKPDWKLRKKLEKEEAKDLFGLLKKIDPQRARNIDRQNKRKLIRALEILVKTEKPVPPLLKKPPQFEILIIGIKKSSQEIKKLIKKRLLKRLKQGMIAETRRLKKAGLSWRRLEEFGLEYRYISLYLQRKLDYQQMLKRLEKEIEHFAKRQMTWFKKDKRIHWLEKLEEAERLIEEFLKK
ncbi:MAG TPA: tRNA (adenosine(37)-N6)-dimethylallyltransferase MiaA [Candidatus Nealsonbacteria bacterium]|uniref:tRNA dimethylallyltransferase n=1 Tax=marine sediment metagenome TaxID=412755 RepID=A0A0F9VSI8_9ZZZZ|nr:tRNA (adenosine(37)-N6)-dimethylallyltransferase MiaA [Candidatus Nealsonbacteria bacterium]HEB46753.1 tRNA (adenosine(37)-N6)-dimethylallyltransferase MiaA [Candidatus Nealsonbacteria bacterium]